MWAHYADGFKGITLEVDIPEQCREVYKVNYRTNFAFRIRGMRRDHRESAIDILCSKHREWSYEKEYRIIVDRRYFQIERLPSRVTIGNRAEESTVERVVEMCERFKVPVYQMSVDHMGITENYIGRGACRELR
jgi:hypothetical protein